MLTLSYSFIGHGFDIHRMAPLELAGQPVVIGGVEITHKDQKVTNVQVLEFQSLKRQVDSLVVSYSGQTQRASLWKRVVFMKRSWVS